MLFLVAVLLCGAPHAAWAGPAVSGRIECGADLAPADRVHCENVLFDVADEKLNAAYQEVLPLLDERTANALRTAQRAWVAYRDMNFETFAAAVPEQGQAGLADRVREMRIATRQRTAELVDLALLVRRARELDAAPGPGQRPTGDADPATSGAPGMEMRGPDAPVPEPPEADTPAPEAGRAPAVAEAAPPSPPDAARPDPPPATAEPAAPGAELPGGIPPDGFAPDGVEPTAVKSEEGLALLLGRHSLRLQWLSHVRSGEVEAVDRDGVVWLSGRQGSGADELRVEGRVSTVREDSFTLHGRVITRVNYLAGGAPCVREGVLWFVRKHGRPFWRLQSITNPCTGVSDYIDITVDRLR